ncbi:MAG: hypothetical protein JST46_09590 [Bacteroidetes bacterium]|nr:hypothetical protein [Bacteroidota bacterium]
MMHRQLTLCCLFISSVISAAWGQGGCNLKLKKDSISVYSCKAKTSKFNVVKATFPVHARLSELASIVFDIDHMKEWQYETLRAELLKRISETEIIYYTEVKAPVLTDNRDFVIHLKADQNPRTKVLTIVAESLPNYIPRKRNIVRVPYSKAIWTVTRTGNNHLHVEYTIDIDLGGAVPPWMVNLVSHQAPYETFSALRSKISSYRGKGMKPIRD